MVNKTQVRTFSNTRGEGKFFNFDVLDSSGCDVRIVGFNECVDRFFEVVQKGQIVKISKATAKPKRNVRVHIHGMHVHAARDVRMCVVSHHVPSHSRSTTAPCAKQS